MTVMMPLLTTIQFGIQPLLSKKMIHKESPKLTIVFATEFMKVLMCA